MSDTLAAEDDDLTVRLERDGDVGVIVIDNPPVNTVLFSVRDGIFKAVREIAHDDALVAGVVIGAGRDFMAGADFREFDTAAREPTLPTVIAAIENCPKPIVAALHGAALGGGLELALGCDRRVAAPDAVVGLPEVTFGMIPGAGGTQRLPRLVGVAGAIEIILSGRRLPAKEAATLGIVDAVIEGDLRDEAVAAARSAGGKRVVALLPVPEDGAPPPENPVAQRFSRRLSRASVTEAIAAVRSAATLPVTEALERDRQTFLRLRNEEEAVALRVLFFAERAARRPPGIDRNTARRVRRVGVVGAGTMGAGIAAVFAIHGFDVTLVDSSQQALSAARKAVVAAAGRGRQKDSVRRVADPRIRYSGDIADVADADLIVEAVFEDIDVKCGLMGYLGKMAKASAILATNTSYLDVDEIAAASGVPERVLGLHFFAPAHATKLIEIVRGRKTAADVIATGLALARRLGKTAVVAAVGEGFIGNRIYSKFRAQCEFMLEEGALPDEIDAAVETMGFVMGPFKVSDLSGLDIAWSLRKAKAPSRDPRRRYVAVADKLCEMGRFGRKTGGGWYDYPKDADGPVPSELVARIIAENRPADVELHTIEHAEIRDRVMGTIINEAACILEDRIARAPGDIDLVLVNGYGYSRYKGGPLFQAMRTGRAAVEKMVASAEKAAGYGFRRGDLSLILPAESA